MNEENKHKTESDDEKSEKIEVGQVASADISRESGKKLEHGGPKGLEPTRYGDWERKGRCIDF